MFLWGECVMTEKDRERIIKLRLMGLGYKAIGQKLNMSRDAVRGFCKRNHIDGDVTAAKLNYEEKRKKKNVCENCGAEIIQSAKGKKKRFCSDKCRLKWWSKNYELHNFNEKNIHSFVCAGCGKKFTSYSNKSRKYCSHECYIKHRFGGKEND